MRSLSLLAPGGLQAGLCRHHDVGKKAPVATMMDQGARYGGQDYPQAWVLRVANCCMGLIPSTVWLCEGLLLSMKQTTHIRRSA